jgi:uncharacterized membrane protein
MKKLYQSFVYLINRMSWIWDIGGLSVLLVTPNAHSFSSFLIAPISTGSTSGPTFEERGSVS